MLRVAEHVAREDDECRLGDAPCPSRHAEAMAPMATTTIPRIIGTVTSQPST